MIGVLPRVAVLGVPRGGTSMVTGLLRILGYRLPAAQWQPICRYGESRALRVLAPDVPLSHSMAARRVNGLPDGVVWKDPGVGDYAGLVDWSRWKTVVVTRGAPEVAASEHRHGSTLPMASLESEVFRRFLGIQDALEAQSVSPEAMLPFDTSREVPRDLLAFLADALDLPKPLSIQSDLAEAFVQPGYRCPLPGACFLDHPDS